MFGDPVLVDIILDKTSQRFLFVHVVHINVSALLLVLCLYVIRNYSE